MIVGQRGVDVLGHPGRVTAHVEVRAVLQPAPHARRRARASCAARRPARAWSRENARSSRLRKPSRDHVLEIVAVVEVLGAVLVAEEQPVAAGCARARGAPAGSRGTARCRCPGPTMIIGVDRSSGGRKCGERCRNTGTGRAVGAVGEERRAHPAARAAVGAAVAHHRHRQLHLVRADQRAATRSSTAAASAAPAPPATPPASARTGELGDEVEPVAVRQPAVAARRVAAQQLGAAASRTVLGDELQQVRA